MRRPLPTVGYNPSVLPIAAGLIDGGAYVATSRFEQANRRHCYNEHVIGNEHARFHSRYNSHGSTRLDVLDGGLATVRRSYVRDNAGCFDGRHRCTDARLLRDGGAYWLTYVSFWGRAECRGHWLAPIDLRNSTVDTTRRVRMSSPRNGGVLRTAGRRYELVDAAPRLLLRDMARNTTTSVATRYGGTWHNSLHPLWLADWRRYLVVGHRHREAGGARFEFGHDYEYVLMLLDPGRSAREASGRAAGRRPTAGFAAARVTNHSRPLCVAGGGFLSGDGCRDNGVKYITGAWLEPSRSPPLVRFSFGVDDCRSALLELRLDELGALFVDGGGVLDGGEAPT